jgi:hypothetical protein
MLEAPFAGEKSMLCLLPGQISTKKEIAGCPFMEAD